MSLENIELSKPSDRQTLGQWLSSLARHRPLDIAIRGTEGQSLCFRDLDQLVHQLGDALHFRGIQAGDVVAVLMPDGPEALAGVLGVMSCATVLPLSVRDRPGEWEQLLGQVPFRAILAHSSLLTTGETSAALLKLCARLNASLLEIAIEESDRRWTCRIRDAAGPGDRDPAPSLPASARLPSLSDPAILVGTAGSTSLPKLVSLTHESLFASIDHAANWLKLGPDDLSLCIMPLAHLHSLVRSTLPGLLRGGQVVCTPGFDPVKMTQWLDEFRPTYFTGAPSMFRALCQRARIVGWKPPDSRLRFVVVGSDAVDPSVIEDGEALLGVPMMQFFGLSEVSPLVAIRPWPPETCPPGAAGRVNPVWRVRILDDNDRDEPVGRIGQIVIKGGWINSIAGAKNNDAAGPAQRFEDGWFYTGDLGRLDDSGFLWIHGRTDDRISRSGKKISPVQVESALQGFPGVAQAAAFPVPDEGYGQRVGAAVVPVPGTRIDVRRLRQWIGTHLGDERAPEHLVVCRELPLSATGKIQRRRLAAHFGVQGRPRLWVIDPDAIVDSTPAGVDAPAEQDEIPAARPPAPVSRPWESADIPQKIVIDLFAHFLNLSPDKVGVDSSFFDLGGNSLTALDLMSRLGEVFGRDISAADLFEHDTPAKLAKIMVQTGWKPNSSLLLRIQPSGRGNPIFALPGLWSFPLGFIRLAECLKPLDQPFYAMEISDRHDSIEANASQCIIDLSRVQPKGPYHLMGYSLGCILILEMARQLQDAGHEVQTLIMIDPPIIRTAPSLADFVARARYEVQELRKRISDFKKRTAAKRQHVMRLTRMRDRYTRAPLPKAVGRSILMLTDERIKIDGYVKDWNDVMDGEARNLIVGPHIPHHRMLDHPDVQEVSQILIKALQSP